MKNIVVLIIVATLLIGCKKGQADFVVKGTLVDIGTNQPIAGATITVYKKMAIGGSQNILTVVNTSADGKYEFVVKRDQFEYIRMVAEKDLYFTVDESYNLDELTLKNDNVINLETTGKSWVGVRLIQSSNPNTKINVLMVEGKRDCEECCSGGYTQFTGIIDTTYYCINDANSLYKVSYNVVGGGATGEKSVTTTFGDTTYIQISY